jgi:hypothetical protein
MVGGEFDFVKRDAFEHAWERPANEIDAFEERDGVAM